MPLLAERWACWYQKYILYISGKLILTMMNDGPFAKYGIYIAMACEKSLTENSNKNGHS